MKSSDKVLAYTKYNASPKRLILNYLAFAGPRLYLRPQAAVCASLLFGILSASSETPLHASRGLKLSNLRSCKNLVLITRQ